MEHRVVCELMEKLFGSGTDIFLRQCQLQNSFVAEEHYYYNKIETKKKPEIISSHLGVTVVSFVPAKNKTVGELSTRCLHNPMFIENHKKSDMILEYNRTKGGMNNADKLLRGYTCARYSSK